jgi:hypothetical protein
MRHIQSIGLLCGALLAPTAIQISMAQTVGSALVNPAMQEQDAKGPRHWTLSKGTLPTDFRGVKDGNKAAIRHVVSGEAKTVNQRVKLKPLTTYHLKALVRGTGSMGIRARSAAAAGAATRAYATKTKPTEAYVPVQVEFTSGYDGGATIILGSTADDSKGEVYVAELVVVEGKAPAAATTGATATSAIAASGIATGTTTASLAANSGAIAVRVGEDEVTRVRKLPVADVRSVRGFMASPVDGSTESYSWNGRPWEYDQRGGNTGIRYEYNNNSGLHITLAETQGVDAVRLRGGVQVDLFGPGASWRGVGSARKIQAFEGTAQTSLVSLSPRVQGKQFSFFDVKRGSIADVAFFQVTRGNAAGTGLPQPHSWAIGTPLMNTMVGAVRDRYFKADERTSYMMRPTAAVTSANAGGVLSLAVSKTVHFMSKPLEAELGLAAIGIDARTRGLQPGTVLAVSVYDAVNPRAELMGAEFAVEGVVDGRLRLVLDFPDQVVPQGKTLWISLRANKPLKLAGMASGTNGGSAPGVQLYTVSKGTALKEAVPYRKLLLKGQFQALSEPRPFLRMPATGELEAWYAKETTGDALRELYGTLDYIYSLAPSDDIVRQYHEWLYRRRVEVPMVARIDAMPGAPEWATVVRQAWLEARKIPQWWMENRGLDENGELGGVLGDDSDFYQNLADFPMMEEGGVGALVRERGLKFLRLLSDTNLENGLNRRTMDPLHAYEEGINQIALQTWWNYGDPAVFERAMQSAKSTEALTIKTPLGHRHFKSQQVGVEQATQGGAIDYDGAYHVMMLHPALEVAWYNRNPRALGLVRDWTDSLLAHQKPGTWISAIDVEKEEALDRDKPRVLKRPKDWDILTARSFGGQQVFALTFLADITRDPKYLQWARTMFEADSKEYISGGRIDDSLADLWHRDALTVNDGIKTRSGMVATLATGDKAPLIETLKRDIAALQRYPYIYTAAEQFTDRIFLYQISNAAMAYTGGFATRNKLHQTHAVSYKGFGTDYAALVQQAGRDKIKVLLYNFSDKPLNGNMAFWRLEHGRYQWTLGPDVNNDDRADNVLRQGTVELQRASELGLTLPPRQVVVLELQQVEKLDDELLRADLALSPSQTRIEGDTVIGVAHNIGAAAAACEVALIDPQGKVMARQNLGEIAAPLDLTPQRREFRVKGLPADARGWKIALDVDGQVAEIYEGNNAIALPVSPS